MRCNVVLLLSALCLVCSALATPIPSVTRDVILAPRLDRSLKESMLVRRATAPPLQAREQPIVRSRSDASLIQSSVIVRRDDASLTRREPAVPAFFAALGRIALTAGRIGGSLALRGGGVLLRTGVGFARGTASGVGRAAGATGRGLQGGIGSIAKNGGDVIQGGSRMLGNGVRKSGSALGNVAKKSGSALGNVAKKGGTATWNGVKTGGQKMGKGLKTMWNNKMNTISTALMVPDVVKKD